jgi:hypothetical protein
MAMKNMGMECTRCENLKIVHKDKKDNNDRLLIYPHVPTGM